MKLRVLFSAGCTALMLCATGPALAQAASSPTPNAATIALVKRFFVATQIEAQIDATLEAMLPVMADQQAKLNPALTAKDRQLIAEITREVMRDTFTPKIVERATSLYAATFTESELSEIVTFYESPGGQAIISKSPSLAPGMAQIVRELMPEATGEMAKRLCAKTNCLQSPATLPKPKAS